MGADSAIQWTDHTFNAWIGCTKVSPGCANCYASVDTFARMSRAQGRELWGADAERHVTSDSYWRAPLKWNRAAERAGRRARVFCSSLSDWLEDRPDLIAPRARLAGLIAATPWLDWLLLSKRPENALRLAPWGANAWPANVWAGTTAEDQKRLKERAEALRKIPASVLFLSCEPLIETVYLLPWLRSCSECGQAPRAHSAPCPGGRVEPGVDWVICGGESGFGARPCALEWIQSIVDECEAAACPVFVKQLGARPYVINSNWWDLPSGQFGAEMPIANESGAAACRVKLADRKGGVAEEWPESLRVREWPQP